MNRRREQRDEGGGGPGNGRRSRHENGSGTGRKSGATARTAGPDQVGGKSGTQGPGSGGSGPSRGSGSSGGPGHRPPLRASHKILLALFGVAFAVLLVLGLEGVLRLAGYGPDLSVFHKVKILGTEYWEFNRDVSLRYFPPEMAREPGFERFPVEKSPDTYRVISLGASSTIGDPFGAQSSYSAFLEKMLQDLHPDRKIEVINCGIVAISSTDVLDLLPEALKRQPDAVLIYTGHNEAYGADAVLSGLRATVSSRFAMKTRIALRNSRVGILLSRFTRRLRPRGGSPEKEFGMDLMQGKVLPHWSDLHGKMLEIYEGNLREMVERSRKAGVDVLLCTLASNLRDQSPFGSAHGPALSPEQETPWHSAFDEGRSQMATGLWDQARLSLGKAADLDSSYAEGRFRLARCLDQPHRDALQGIPGTEFQTQTGGGDSGSWDDRDEAWAQYTGARDEDTVHFRACSDENRIVRKVTAEMAGPDLVLIDLEKDLAAASPDGIPGDEIMTEHVHPYPRGHAFFAEEICRALAASTAGAKLGSWDFSRLDTTDHYLKRLGLSEVDEAAGLWVTVRYKMGKWPFTQAYENDLAIEKLEAKIAALTDSLDPITAGVFDEMQSGRFPLGYDYGYRHQAIAQRAQAAQKVDQAIREFALCQDYWGPTAELSTNMAQANLMKGDLAATDSLLTLAAALDPSFPRFRFVRGMLDRAQGRMPEARKEFEEYLRLEPTGVFANAARQFLMQSGR